MKACPMLIARAHMQQSQQLQQQSSSKRVGALSLIPFCLGISGHPSGSRQGHPRYTGARTAGRPWVARTQFSAETRQTKFFGGDEDLRTSTLIRHRSIQGESHVDFLGESEGSLPQPHDSFPDAGEAMNDFWSMSGNFIYRHHVETRVKLYSPREESFPIPLKYIDVSRTTHTNLDVKQEKRIDDYWNIDGSRDLSDPWTGFTQFTLLEEKPPDGYTWSGGRLTRKQQTSRPDHLWPELWKSMGKNAKLKEKQNWFNEKLHLENARKLRGIYVIDPEDKEFKETLLACPAKL